MDSKSKIALDGFTTLMQSRAIDLALSALSISGGPLGFIIKTLIKLAFRFIIGPVMFNLVLSGELVLDKEEATKKIDAVDDAENLNEFMAAFIVSP